MATHQQVPCAGSPGKTLTVFVVCHACGGTAVMPASVGRGAATGVDVLAAAMEYGKAFRAN